VTNSAVLWSTVSLSMLAGLGSRRLLALLAPVALTLLAFVGLDHDWWGGGLGPEWHPEFVALLVYACFATAVGRGLRLVVDRVGRGVGGRRWTPVWTAGACLSWIGAAGVYGYATTRPADVSAIRSAPGPEVYYLGDSFEGSRLTHARSYGAITTFTYGVCDPLVGMVDESVIFGPRCDSLHVENIACPGEPTAVVINAEVQRAKRAIAALQLLRGTGSSPRIAIGTNPFVRCFPPPTR